MTNDFSQVDPQVDTEVFRIWDDLSDTAAGQPEAAARLLMGRLCAFSGASSATWAGAVRVGQDGVDDALYGWRVAAMYVSEPRGGAGEAAPESRFRAILNHWDRREIDPSFLLPLRDVGAFRTYAFRRDLPGEWFEAPFYRTHYEVAGTVDAVFVAFPLNEDCESHFGFYGGQTFTDDRIARLAGAIRGIKWFHRRLLMSHGLSVASSPLTPAERRVLAPLLTGAAEKRIALDNGIAASTVHEHVLSIYRKFGVRSRAGLMALWLITAA